MTSPTPPPPSSLQRYCHAAAAGWSRHLAVSLFHPVCRRHDHREESAVMLCGLSSPPPSLAHRVVRRIERSLSRSPSPPPRPPSTSSLISVPHPPARALPLLLLPLLGAIPKARNEHEPGIGLRHKPCHRRFQVENGPRIQKDRGENCSAAPASMEVAILSILTESNEEPVTKERIQKQCAAASAAG